MPGADIEHFRYGENMDIQTLANIGEFLGGLAIFVSLIFLVVNVRQNTAQLGENLKELQRIEKRSAYEQHDRFRVATLDRELADVFLKGLSGEGLPEPADRMRFGNLMTMQTYAVLNGWDTVQKGLMEEDEWTRIIPLFVRMTSTPGGSKWWEKSNSYYPPGFVDDVEAYRQNQA